MSFELPLPAFEERELAPSASDATDYLLGLLREAAPGADIVAVARRPGVLSKVGVRSGLIAGDVIARLRAELDGEHIQVVQWQAEPRAFIAAALGLPQLPPMVLKPAIRHAHVLLGEIDLRGMSGWRGINRLLASQLTGWRIHLEPVAATSAWRRLAEAQRQQRPLLASRIDAQTVEVLGLRAVVREGIETEELSVRVLRMDADEGRVWVTSRLGASGQLRLPQQ